MPDVEAPDVEVQAPIENGSLASRMRQRGEELERQVSQRFPIPTWDEILEVELRLVGWEALRKIATRHERNRDKAMQELYIAADQLIMGTEGFFEIPESGGRRRIEDASWVALARMAGRNLPEDVTPRQALIALVGDTNVLVLWKDWLDWSNTRRPDVEEEVSEDFQMTR